MEQVEEKAGRYVPRLKVEYDEEIVPALTEQFEYGNTLQVPRLVKITVNMGIGEGITNAKAVEAAAGDLAVITGQHPILIKARHSVANFKLRAGMTVGCKVTLRGDRMFEFLESMGWILLLALVMTGAFGYALEPLLKLVEWVIWWVL